MSMDAQQDRRLVRRQSSQFVGIVIVLVGFAGPQTSAAYGAETPSSTADVFGDVDAELDLILQKVDGYETATQSSAGDRSDAVGIRVAARQDVARVTAAPIDVVTDDVLSGAGAIPRSPLLVAPPNLKLQTVVDPLAGRDVANSSSEPSVKADLSVEAPAEVFSSPLIRDASPGAAAVPSGSQPNSSVGLPSAVEPDVPLNAPSTPESELRSPRVAAKLPNEPARVAPQMEPPAERASPTAVPTKSPPPMPQSVRLLRRPIERALQLHVRKRLNSADNSCWSMMHAFLGWGAGTEIHVGGPRGRRVNAIQWIANNQPCAKRQLFRIKGDRIQGNEGPGYQGHPAQFLAMVAQCQVDESLSMSVNGRKFRLTDLLEEEKRTCALGTELTFKLLGLSYYLSTADQWVCDKGQSWNLERLLSDELSQPVNGVACGGTHRLMGISFALAKRRSEGLPIDGVWASAERYIADYHRYALTLTNRDGSFSTDWFRTRADRGDKDRRLQTTGHILEWLVFSLPEEALYDHRVSRAVNFLSSSLAQHRHHEWEVGPKGHAVRALQLYHQRVFQRRPLALAPIARSTPAATAARR